ncbi:MAG TPA: metalloregulator ArsR/SmtB family transcription factor [Phycisphaerales bacterium]|nr:metalloregulator ArsR/SmtB family transcription factor [Phycisphaerales bacterium]
MSAARRNPSTRPRAHTLVRRAPLFAALGDQTRLVIVTRLCDGSTLSITRLSEGAAITRQAVTKHLRVLQDAGLVRSVRRGRENLFELEPKSLDEARRALDAISRQWDEALARLKSFVESD